MSASTNIAILAKKGGVGKSAISLSLYEALRHAGREVSIHDWDLQGTSTKALRQIHGSDYKPDHRGKIVIWDTPPSLDHTATATAVRNAQIVLVLTSPALPDTWEAQEAVDFARSRNAKATLHLLFNKVRKTTILGRLVEESAKKVNAPTLPVMLSARECYQHVYALGWKALDSDARQEVLQLAVALLSL